MAADAAAYQHVKMATLSEHTMAQLNAVLPPNWSHGNPVDLIGDAVTEERIAYVALDAPSENLAIGELAGGGPGELAAAAALNYADRSAMSSARPVAIVANASVW